MLKAVSNEAQRQRLNGDRSLFLGAPVSRHARESGNVRQPAAILFTEVFDGQAESAFQWCIRQASMMAANRGSSPGCLAPPSFGTKAALASAAAWSPNPKNPPLYIDAESGLHGGQDASVSWIRWATIASSSCKPERLLAHGVSRRTHSRAV